MYKSTSVHLYLLFFMLALNSLTTVTQSKTEASVIAIGKTDSCVKKTFTLPPKTHLY